MDCVFCNQPIESSGICLDRDKLIFEHAECSTDHLKKIGQKSYLKYPHRVFYFDIYESFPQISNLKDSHNVVGSQAKTVGRPSLGLTKKVSVTLPDEEWQHIEQMIEMGHVKSLSDYFRTLHIHSNA